MLSSPKIKGTYLFLGADGEEYKRKVKSELATSESSKHCLPAARNTPLTRKYKVLDIEIVTSIMVREKLLTQLETVLYKSYSPASKHSILLKTALNKDIGLGYI